MRFEEAYRLSTDACQSSRNFEPRQVLHPLFNLLVAWHINGTLIFDRLYKLFSACCTRADATHPALFQRLASVKKGDGTGLEGLRQFLHVLIKYSM